MLFTIILMSSSVYGAPMYISGYVTLGSVNVPDDIIIEPGGTLNITGPVHMGSPSTPAARVIVQDGGKLYSNGGSLIAYGPGHFEGIVVESTPYFGGNPFNAVELINFTIDGADLGLKIEYIQGPTLADLNVNQRIEMTQSTFTNCVRNVYSTSAGGSGGGPLNESHSYNPVIFDNCNFLGGASTWPNHLINLRDLRLLNCTISTTAQIILHMRDIRDLVVDNCTFVGSTNSVGMLFHGSYDNSTVVNNTFNALKCGISVTWGSVSNSVFSGNSFTDTNLGITVGNVSGFISYFTSTLDGDANNVEVSNNYFENNDIGIQCGSASLGTGYGGDNFRVIGNEFQACIRGVLFNGENTNITVNCNDFYDTQLAGIEIDDVGLSSFILTGQDDYNQFDGSLIDDIKNANPMATFSYENLTGTSYPLQPTLFSNVTLLPVVSYMMCE